MNICVDQQATKTRRHSSVITGHIQPGKFVSGTLPMNFQCARSFLFLRYLVKFYHNTYLKQVKK